MKNKRPEKTGMVNENIIESLLNSYGYKKITTKEMNKIIVNDSLMINKEKVYCKHFPVDGQTKVQFFLLKPIDN